MATKSKAQVKEAATFRPEDLAKELGISGKQVRAFLRKTYQDHEKRTSWVLNEKQATAVREHFSKSEDDTDEE
jgi:hypothetical protein